MLVRNLCLSLLAVTPLAAFAQAPQNARPPLDPAAAPALRSAHRIFLANGGVDNIFTLHTGKPEATLYNSVYAALQTAPGVQMVDTSQQADLVLTIVGSSATTIYKTPSNTCIYCPTEAPHKQYDDQASITLSGFAADPQGFHQVWTDSLRLDKPKLCVAQAAYQLVNEMLSDAGRAATAAAYPSRHATPPAAPLPALLRDSTTAMVVRKFGPPVSTRTSDTTLLLSARLASWDHDTLTTDPAAASLLFVIKRSTHHDNTLFIRSDLWRNDTVLTDTTEPALTLEVIERSTGLTLWAVEAPFKGDLTKASDYGALKHVVDQLVNQFRRSTGLTAGKVPSSPAKTTD